MSNQEVRSGEILFIKCVKDGIPNRDPLRDSDARRIFGEDDRRISLSDVSIKRDVRDYILSKYPDGGPDKKMFIFVRKERTEGNLLLGRQKLAEAILERAGKEKEKDPQGALIASAFDMRVFGAVFSVAKSSFSQVGPVQFGWAHSLHPVESKYIQGTVVMPSRDARVTEEGIEEGATQGTIWTSYIVPFAVFAMPGVVNGKIAHDTGMSTEDIEILLEALWKGTTHRQARGRGIQQPLLLLYLEYKDPFDRIGFLEEKVRIEPGLEVWEGPKPPASLAKITLDVEHLAEIIKQNEARIERTRVWLNPELALKGELPAEMNSWS